MQPKLWTRFRLQSRWTLLDSSASPCKGIPRSQTNPSPHDSSSSETTLEGKKSPEFWTPAPPPSGQLYIAPFRGEILLDNAAKQP